MTNSTLRIFIFIETSFRSEDFNHAIEHRFFENPAILALEDDSHTSISAYAHVTGILFKITTVKHSESRVMKNFDAAFNGEIPNFSEEERKRFEQELKEREFDKEAWFAYSGFFWYIGTETDFSFSAKDIAIDSENFDHMKNVVAFDTKVGHENVSFAQNVILGINPQDEIPALDSVTLEGFLEYLKKTEIATRAYSK